MRDGSSGYSWYSECVIYLRCGYSGRKCLSIRYVYTWEHDREMASQVHIQRTQFMQQEVGLNSQLKSRSSRSPLTKVESSRERGQKSSRSIESIGNIIVLDRSCSSTRSISGSTDMPLVLAFPYFHSHSNSHSYDTVIVTPVPMGYQLFPFPCTCLVCIYAYGKM